MFTIVTQGINAALGVAGIIVTAEQTAQIKELQGKLEKLNQEYKSIGADLETLMDLFKDSDKELKDLQVDGARLDIIMHDQIDTLASHVIEDAQQITGALQNFTVPTADSSKVDVIAILSYVVQGISVMVGGASFVKSVVDYRNTIKTVKPKDKNLKGFTEEAIELQETSFNETIAEVPVEERSLPITSEPPVEVQSWYSRALGWEAKTTTFTKVLTVVSAVLDMVTMALQIYFLAESIINFNRTYEQLNEQIQFMNEQIEKRTKELPDMRILLAGEAADLPTFFLALSSIPYAISEALDFLLPFQNSVGKDQCQEALKKITKITPISPDNISIYKTYTDTTNPISVKRNNDLDKLQKNPSNPQLKDQVDKDSQAIINNFKTLVYNKLGKDQIIGDVIIARNAYSELAIIANYMFAALTDVSNMIAFTQVLSNSELFSMNLPDETLYKLQLINMKQQFESLSNLSEKQFASIIAMFVDYNKVLQKNTFLGYNLDDLLVEIKNNGGYTLSTEQQKELAIAFKGISEESSKKSVIASNTENSSQPTFFASPPTDLSNKDEKTIKHIILTQQLINKEISGSSSDIKVSDFTGEISKILKDIYDRMLMFASLRSSLDQARPKFNMDDIFSIGDIEIEKQMLRNDIDLAEESLDKINQQADDLSSKYNQILSCSGQLYNLAYDTPFYKDDLTNLGLLALSQPTIDIKFISEILTSFTTAYQTVQFIYQSDYINSEHYEDIQSILISGTQAANLTIIQAKRKQVQYVIAILNKYRAMQMKQVSQIELIVQKINKAFEDSANLINIINNNDLQYSPTTQRNQIANEIQKVNRLLIHYCETFERIDSLSKGDYLLFSNELIAFKGQIIYGNIKTTDFMRALYMWRYVQPRQRILFFKQKNIPQEQSASLLRCLQVMDSMDEKWAEGIIKNLA